MTVTGHTNLHRGYRILALAVLGFTTSVANGQPRDIDGGKSSITVRVYKTGLLSAFAHDHEISAAISRGTVDVSGRKVELTVETAGLRVRDPKVSEKDRKEIQDKMLSADVLDAEQYREIRFQSTSAEPAGDGAWKVSGRLTVHGVTQAVAMQVRGADGRYTGTCRFKVSDFGIKPVSAAGGTVRVKDEVQIEFDIRLTN